MPEDGNLAGAWHHAKGLWTHLPGWLKAVVVFVASPLTTVLAAWYQGLPPLVLAIAGLGTIVALALALSYLDYSNALIAAKHAEAAYWLKAPSPPSRQASAHLPATDPPVVQVKGFGGQRAQLEITQQGGASGYLSVRARVESCSGIATAKHRATFLAYQGQTRPGEVTVATLATFGDNRWLAINENTWKVPNAEAKIRMTFSVEWDRGSELRTLEAGDCVIVTAPWQDSLEVAVTLASKQ